MPFRKENRPVTLALVLIVASLLVVGIGVQAYVAQRDNEDRDRADRAYADCLTEFATDLVATIEVRSEATIRLEKAERRLLSAEENRDTAADAVFRIVALTRRTPPKASEGDFDGALREQVKAQQQYAEVRDRVEEVRDRVGVVRERNDYESPKVACMR